MLRNKRENTVNRQYYTSGVEKSEWTQAILQQKWPFLHTYSVNNTMNLYSLKSSTNGEQNFSQNRAKTAVFGGKTVSWRNLKVQLYTNLEELEI